MKDNLITLEQSDESRANINRLFRQGLLRFDLARGLLFNIEEIVDNGEDWSKN